jgi:tRNA C32,U32 (ribose-2'-O)-methylase TrmJ
VFCPLVAATLAHWQHRAHREHPVSPREVTTMADKATAKNRDDVVSTEKKLDDLYELIDGIEIAMFTTRRADGHLV